MKIVIDLSEEDFVAIRDCHAKCGEDLFNLRRNMAIAIRNGTPLPEGHGRLKDIDKVERLLDLDKPDNAIAKALKNIMESVPTIVDADRGEE